MYARRLARDSGSAGRPASSAAATKQSTNRRPRSSISPLCACRSSRADWSAHSAEYRGGAPHPPPPQGGQPLDVRRVQVGVRERVVELRVGQAPGVVCGGQGAERRPAAGEVEQRRPHGGGVWQGAGGEASGPAGGSLAENDADVAADGRGAGLAGLPGGGAG